MVSDALNGKFEQQPEVDERLVKLLKTYYRGRRSTMIGFLASVIAIVKLTLAFLAVNREFLDPGLVNSITWTIPVFIALLIVGLAWFFWGASGWLDSSSELKALGYDEPRQALPNRNKQVASLPEGSTVLRVKNFATDSLPEAVLPAAPSVTESTTRFLEEDEKPLAPAPRQAAN
jgi:hypothetical protein